MQRLARARFDADPALAFAAIGTRGNATRLNVRPYGVSGSYLAAEDHSDVVAAYLALNRRAFPRLPLAEWVLSDVYLLPTVIAAIVGPPDRLPPEVRAAIPASEPAILAAWVGVPTLHPTIFAGVSLLSVVPGLGTWAKALGTAALGARGVVGVTQWKSPSLRAHTRLGPMRVTGRVPGGHDLAEDSFAYSCDLSDEDAIVAAMTRRHPMTATARVALSDLPALAGLIATAEAGHAVWIVPPGVRDGALDVRIEYARGVESR